MKLQRQLPKTSFKKLSNLSLLGSSYLYSRLTGKLFHRGYPVTLSLEPTNQCNLHCPECGRSQNINEKIGYMDLELFQSIINQCSSFLFSVMLYFLGEPMLHPAFIEMIQYASRKKIYTITSTNGQSLTPEIAHAIIESGLDEIVVSMDGLDQDSYEKYRVGGNIDKVKAGIQSMVTWKRDLASKQPEITLQFLVFSHNQHQIEEVKNWGKSAGVDRVVLKTVRIKDKSRENPLLPETKYSRYLQRDNLSYATKGNLKNHCWQSWSKAVITWDGKVLPCCFDVGKNFKMGTVGEKSLLEIWKSKQYGAFRKQILDNRKKYSMCCNCTEGTSYTL